MSATSTLRTIAAWLGGVHDRGGRSARGAREGIPTEVRFALRGTGYERTSHDRRWTEIDVQMPKGYGLSLFVRRHEWTDLHQIERNAMVDVELGDAKFDREFLVEAAPAQIARMVLDPSIRGLLASYDAASLTTEALADRPVLRLTVRTWLRHDAITVAGDALVRLSAGLRDAYAALDAAALRDTGAPYRPQLDDAQVDAQRSALTNEVELIAALRQKR
jgi:hypothetical protein